VCGTEPTTIARIIASPLSDDWLNRQARQLGVVKRQRTVEASALMWVLVLAFSHHKNLAIAALQRTYARRTGHNISYSTFYDRFTPALKALLKQAVLHVTDHCKTLIPHFDHPLLNAFTRLTVIDSTLIGLHPSLRKVYPSTNDNCAKLKIHAVYLATMGLFDRFKFSDGLTHDRKKFKRVGPSLKGSMVLMDLGYWCFHLQWLIAQNEAYFLTRAKTGFNPLITAVHGTVRGASIDVVGKRLQEVLSRLKRQVIDFEVEVEFEKEARGGKRAKQTAKWRLVGILNKETGEHHLYLTNIGPDEMEAKLVAELYRERWQVERSCSRPSNPACVLTSCRPQTRPSPRCWSGRLCFDLSSVS